MGFSVAAMSDFRHVPVHPLRHQLPNNSDEHRQTNGEPRSCNPPSHEPGETVEKPRRIRIRVRRPVGRGSEAGKILPQKRRRAFPLPGPDVSRFSPQMQALLFGAFIATVFVLWHFLHVFR